MTEKLLEGWRSAVGIGTVTDADDERHEVKVEFPHDRVDSYDTTFGPDCFRGYFEKHMPAMCWQHDIRDIIGRATSAQVLPTHNEVVGRFSDFDAVPQAHRAYAHIRDGDITDYSFHFRNAKARPHPTLKGKREFIQADMPEFSPVTLGSIPGAQVTGLRSEETIVTVPTIEEILALQDRHLLDEAGVRAMIAEHHPSLRERIVVASPKTVTADDVRTAIEEHAPELAEGLRDYTVTVTKGVPAATDDGAPATDPVQEQLSYLDAILDSAVAQLEEVDVSQLPDEVQQALALLGAAWVSVDNLMDTAGVYDPDDQDDSPPTNRAMRIGELGLVAPDARGDATFSSKPWSDFKESDYSDAQYRNACLITGETKEQCKLPVKEPDGTVNRNAVAAAAGALAGARGGLKGVSDEDKAKAAKQLVSFYNQMNQKPSPDLLKLAGSGSRSDDLEAEAADAMRLLDRRVA